MYIYIYEKRKRERESEREKEREREVKKKKTDKNTISCWSISFPCSPRVRTPLLPTTAHV